MNDGIDPAWCSLKYSSIDKAVNICRTPGKALLLSKLDIKSVYCMVSVHPVDCHLLGMHWHGALFIDTTLLEGGAQYHQFSVWEAKLKRHRVCLCS